MHAMEIEEIRHLFENAEAVGDPKRKLYFFEEALDLADDFRAERASDSPEMVIVDQLRRSHLHSLLVQLPTTRNIEVDAWLNYIRLFLFRVTSEVQAILSDDPQLQETYLKFVDLWRSDFILALEKAR